MAKPKKKRKASPAQLRALAKGRKKAAANRSNRRKSNKKHSTKGAKVARRKTTSSSKKKAVRHTRKSHHSAPRRRRAKRRHYSMSGSSGGGSGKFGKGIMGPVSEALIAVAGGVIAGVVANKVPIKNDKLKAAAPIIAGAGVAFMGIKKRNPLIRQLGTGMMVLGAVALTRKMLPNVPLLAGEDEDTLALPGYVAAQQAAMAGELEYMGDNDEDGLEFMGDPIDLGDDDIEDMLGDDELDEIHLTPANI